MDRLEAIRDYLKPYKTQRIRENIERIKIYSDEQLLVSVASLLSTAIEVQEQQEWEPVCLCLLHLLSSIVTGSHVYQLLLANEQIYLDELQVTGEYEPEFLYKEDKKALKRELQNKFISLSDYECSYAEHWLQYECRGLMEVYWSAQIEKITEMEEFKRLKKKRPVHFIYGDYMGSLKRVSLYEEED